MDAQVRIGANRNFVLQRALLIYGDGSGAFATLHEVKDGKDGAPYLAVRGRNAVFQAAFSS